MGITEVLRRIWLFSANKIKSSESFSKQPTQLIIKLNSSLRHIIVTLFLMHSVLKQTQISLALTNTPKGLNHTISGCYFQGNTEFRFSEYVVHFDKLLVLNKTSHILSNKTSIFATLLYQIF